jgi:hypothetical protein
MFYAPGLIFGGTEVVGSRFHVLCAELVFRRTEGAGSRFHVLRSRTHYRRYRGRRVSFSCFVCPDSFSTVPRASGPVFMFCSPRLIFGATEGVGSRFHVLRTHNRFRRAECVGFCFHVLRSRTHFRRCRVRSVPFSRFRRCRVRRVSFSCFALPNSFSTVPGESGPVFLFCVPGLVFVGTEGIGSRFHVLHARTRFRRYRGRQVAFSCFALPG